MISSLAAFCVLAVSADFQSKLEAEFNKKEYTFCHNASFRLNEENHAFCEVLTEPSSVCPKLYEVCQGKPLPSKTSRRVEISTPPFEMGAVGEILFGLLIALFVGGIAWVILRQMTWSRHAPEDAPVETTQVDTLAIEDTTQTDPVETDVQRLLKRAQQAASQGNYAKAIEDTYAALLRRLEGDGLIDIHPSRTNGDYVRGLSKAPELRRNVKEIVVDVEKVQFGSETASASRFQAIFERVAPIASKVLFLLLAFNVGCESLEGLSNTPITYGRGAFESLLKAEDIVLTKTEDPLASITEFDGALVLVRPRFDEAQWKQILEWVEQTGSLAMVLGVEGEYPKAWGIERKRYPRSMAEAQEWKVKVPTEWALTVGNQSPDGLLTTPHGVYAFGETGLTEAGAVVFFADDRMLSNLSMATHENAAWLLGLFDDIDSIVFYENPEVVSDANNDALNPLTPMDSVRNAHMSVLMLHILGFALLYIVARGVFFGKPRGRRETVQRAFSEHVRALGLAYERAGAFAHVTRNYVSWALDRLYESRPGGKAGLAQLARALASRTGQSEAEVTAFLEQASMLKRQEAIEGTTPDFTVVKTLETYLSVMGLGPSHRDAKQKSE